MPRGKQSVTRRALLSGGVAAGLTAALAACSAPTEATSPRGSDAQQASSVLALSARSGALRGGSAVTATGSALRGVHGVTVGGTAAPITSEADGRVSFVVPAAADFVAGSAPVVFAAASGAAVARSSWTYRVTDGIDRQLAYLLRYWTHYNPAYDALPDDDCVDFTSQALLVRGWKQQDDWFHAADVLQSGMAWRGSTAFMSFMQDHPSLGTALTDDERAKVKVGDVVQFDWDRSGDRDHTGTVTRVTKTSGGYEVFFAGHTDDSDYRSVDTAITKDHPGGVAYYWSLT